MRNRPVLWCMYTVAGDDEDSPNAFPVVHCGTGSPTLGELAASFAQARPAEGERWHWRVKVSDQTYGYAWEDLVDGEKTVRSEEIAENVFAVFARIVDLSPRACSIRATRGPAKEKKVLQQNGVSGKRLVEDDEPVVKEKPVQKPSPPKPQPAPQPAPAPVAPPPVETTEEGLDSFLSGPSTVEDDLVGAGEILEDVGKPQQSKFASSSSLSSVHDFFGGGGGDDRPVVEDDDDPPLESPITTGRHHVETTPIERLSLAQTISENQASAKEEIRRRKAEAAEHEKEMDRLRQVLGPKLKLWSEDHGKKKNIRALLAGMDKVMWPEANWKAISIGDLLQPTQVKKAYYKASRYCHPDKLVGLTSEQRFIGQTVFDALSQAYTAFEEQGR